MTIDELIERIQESAKHRTPEQEMKMLRKAHILDRNGHYCARFFSKETVEMSKEASLRQATAC